MLLPLMGGCSSGFVLLCVGQVGLWAQAKGDMQFIVDTTELTTDIIKRLAQFMQVAANASVGNVTIPRKASLSVLVTLFSPLNNECSGEPCHSHGEAHEPVRCI